MKNVELKPIITEHSNSKLIGSDNKIEDLPITNVTYKDEERGIVSVWKMNVWTRIKFLFDGRVNFATTGKTHPPISISVGEAFTYMEH